MRSLILILQRVKLLQSHYMDLNHYFKDKYVIYVYVIINNFS